MFTVALLRFFMRSAASTFVHCLIGALFFFTGKATAQDDHYRPDTSIILLANRGAEITNDSVLIIREPSGSGFWHFDLNYKTDTGTVHESYTYSFGTSLSFIPIDRRFSKSDAEQVMKELGHEIVERPDNGFAWFLSALQDPKTKSPHLFYFSNAWEKQFRNVPSEALFIADTAFTNRWFNILSNGLSERWNWTPDVKNYSMWLTYLGINHKNFDTLAVSDKEKVVYSEHGIIFIKGKKHRWVFENDAMLTNGPGKLRWRSVQEVNYREGMIFISFAGGPAGIPTIWAIDPVNGICFDVLWAFNIEHEMDDGGHLDLKFTGDQLQVDIEDHGADTDAVKSQLIPVKEIREKMEGYE